MVGRFIAKSHPHNNESCRASAVSPLALRVTSNAPAVRRVSALMSGPLQMRMRRSAWRLSRTTRRPRTWRTFRSSVGVFGEPAVGLGFLQERRRTPVADDGPGAVLLAIAEPVNQHLLARNFVPPDLRRHVVDEALADQQAALRGVIVDAVGHALRVGGDGTVPGDQRPLSLGHARRAGGSAVGRVGIAFAEGVQPDHRLRPGRRLPRKARRRG